MRFSQNPVAACFTSLLQYRQACNGEVTKKVANSMPDLYLGGGTIRYDEVDRSFLEKHAARITLELKLFMLE